MTTTNLKTIHRAAGEEGVGMNLFPQLKAAIIEAARNNPERVAKCSYVSGDQPQCIVGQAMVDAELMTVEELLEFERNADSFLILETEDGEYPKYLPDSSFRWLAYYFENHLGRGSLGTDVEISEIWNVQQTQDYGGSWGDAINKVWGSE